MSTFERRSVLNGLVVITLLACVFSVGAATIIPLSFSELVERSGLVVEGVVVDLRVVSTGSNISGIPPQANTRSPEVESEPIRVDGERPEDIEAPYLIPIGLPVEGGRMLFTEVTIEVERELVGSAGSRVTFRVAGGSDDSRSVEVFGMPRFRHGGRYLLFLNPGFENTAVPIVGINQGFFEVEGLPDSSEKRVLDYKGDFVIGVEHDQVVVRNNAERQTHPVPALGPAPVPENAYEIEARTSPEVQRYWNSQEPPLRLEAFIEVVTRQVEVQP